MARWRRIGLKLLLYKPTTMPNTLFVHTLVRPFSRLRAQLFAAVATMALTVCSGQAFAALEAPRYQLALQPEATQMLLRQKSGGITQAQAAQIAKKQYGGKVLSVTKKGGDRPVYKVKLLLDDGRVKVVSVDANSGAAR